ncbi:unnamed protein product [Meloidogyne enterolobii]|uniref:Uncharacterized protein n=1 Tax=Meloidogyne enterolobii TaxID=390850 RepID=A0ACB0Y4Y4_MELEN
MTLLLPQEMKFVHSFVVRFLESLGLKPDPNNGFNSPQHIANLFAFADTDGYIVDGLGSLEMTATKIAMNDINVEGQPIVVEERDGIAIIDGSNLLGVTVGNYCASKARELARIYGIGFVVARNANSIGPGQFYARQMVEHGMEVSKELFLHNIIFLNNLEISFYSYIIFPESLKMNLNMSVILNLIYI